MKLSYRYFPLPKERKRKSFDSSDDGFSSDDDFFGRKKSQPVPQQNQANKPSEVKEKEKDKNKEKEKEKIKTKVKIPKTDRPPAEKKKKDKPPKPEKEKKHKEKKPREPKTKAEDNVPKRESTKRAAKTKSNLSEIGKDDEPEEPPEFQDSDSDPAWTPAANNGEEGLILPVKKSKRGRPGESY